MFRLAALATESNHQHSKKKRKPLPLLPLIDIISDIMHHVLTTLGGLALGLMFLSSSHVRAITKDREPRPRTGFIQYALENSEFNVFNSHCSVGRFREVNTLISPGLTDGFSEYLYIPFRPNQAVKIEADLPFALMSVWTSYTSVSNVITGIADSELVLKDGSPNPYMDGNPVMSTNRSYLIYAGKDELVSRFFGDGGGGEPEDWTNANYLTTNSGESEILSVLILRVIGEYGDINGLSQGEWIPKVTLFDENGNQEYCNFFLDQGGMPITNIFDTYVNPNSGLFGDCFLFDADGERDFSFYPLAENKEAALSNTAYGAYVIALPQKELFRNDQTPDTAVVVEFKHPPRVFDPEVVDNYDDSLDVRYTSICLYASTGLGNKCILGTEIYKMWLKYGVAYIVLGPEDQEEYFKGKGIPFIKTIPEWKYFLYRVQLVNNEAYDLTLNIPKWYTECTANVTNGYFKANNESNLGDLAPVGLTCDKDKLQTEGCGFQGLNEILRGTREYGHGLS